MNIIPVVYSATEDEVNGILYEWFIGLGDDGYAGFDEESMFAATNGNRLRYMADMDWLTEEYLGKPLVAVLSRFQGISDIDRSEAPVSFDQLNNSVHTKENTYYNMDYCDIGYRLLGLFRMWNAMEIVIHIWIIWTTTEHIPMMLIETDKKSYESTLASLASKLDDAHVNLNGASMRATNKRYIKAYSSNFIPSPKVSHVLLENNIGLINPSKLRVYIKNVNKLYITLRPDWQDRGGGDHYFLKYLMQHKITRIQAMNFKTSDR